ncbi:hypothetical protein ACW7G0_06375 [Lysobacter sp. A286]
MQLRLKLIAPHRRMPPGEFPPGWQQWFASMSPRAGAVTGASARSIAATMAERPLKAPPRASAPLSRWQALTALGRQQWEPAQRDERGLRWFATVASVGWHVLLAAILVWLIYQQSVNPSHPPPKGEEMVVQIEYVGTGTPEQVGGGPASEPEQQQSTPVPPTPVDDVPDAPTTSAAPPPEALEPPTPEPPAVIPAPPPAPAEVQEVAEMAATEANQPLTVSEPIGEVSDFVLPPTAQRLDAPELIVPELQMSIPAVEVAEVPVAPRPTVSVIEASPSAPPVLEQRPAEVVVREIPIALPSRPLPSVPVPSIPPPRSSPSTVVRPALVAPPSELQAPALQAREIPAVTAAPAVSPTPSTTAMPTVSQSAEPAATAAQPLLPAIKPPGAADQPGVSSNAGPKPTPTPGGWPDPKRGDDWGADAQERPGQQLGQADGLYNSDGSAKLAETPGSASPGKPPGTVTDEIVNLDRNGTWLKRAPTDYEPTAFDQYWRPTETLLEEWVRKSVSTIRIPIPGTSKHIVCHTVLLALGGACGISDPNLADQPATARPSPDIPFKPELQDDNGSVPAGD